MQFFPLRSLFIFFFSLTPLLSLLASEAKALPIFSETEQEKMLMLLSGEWISRALYTAAKLEIADHLSHGSKSIEELAQMAQADPDALSVLLRMAAAYGIFEEVSFEVFANTPLSRLLAKSGEKTLHALALFYGEEVHKSLDELVLGIQSGIPAFQIAFQLPIVSYFKENPEKIVSFLEGRREKSAMVLESILSTYDFSYAKSVYDIGGESPAFMQGLLKLFPQVKGIVFTLPEVIALMKKRGPQLENPRLSFIPGNFFESVPKGGDIYLLQSILHDLDETQCQEVLSNCYGAMEPNCRLLIIEPVLMPKEQSPYAHCLNLIMMAITGRKERSYATFKEMLEASGFNICQVFPTSTEFSIMEARKK